MKAKSENVVLWAAIVIGGGYLIYRLFNQPTAVATPGATPSPVRRRTGG